MNSLVAQIRKAFDGVPMPSEVTLRVADAHDSYDYEHDSEHRAKDFMGYWQDIPAEHLKRYPMGLTHLQADGIRFYLPATMVWVINNFRESDSMLVDWTIYQLASNRDDPNLSLRFDKRFSLFNPSQRFVCRLFLEFLLFEDPDGDHIDATVAAEALSTEWANQEG